MENQTTVTYFVLLGFSYNPPVQMLLFFTFSLIYMATLLGNMMIMIVIRSNRNLHSPMYFFLSHLSFLDICYSSVTVPKLLTNFYGSKLISYSGCIAQIYFIFLTGTTEAFILAAMAFDRYTAICKPMHYVQIMNIVFCRLLVGSAWAISSLYSMINTLSLLKLVFCGPNIIEHFSCELPSLLALSCMETLLNRIRFFLTATTLTGSSFFIILASYIQIISTVLKMHSAAAKWKTFSTCSSHLIVVVLFYGTGIIRHMRPTSTSLGIVDEFFSIQYSISTPLLNPIIYSLKTKEVKEAIKKLIAYKSWYHLETRPGEEKNLHKTSTKDHGR
ncbi:olfactory receptor 5A1-like [Hemicordylus capensis]|uniref:olfactory receptor 5A1-like n=1 Tax=Hemicordylus capensis TaxID=884348 RepID=UPI00230228AF|nr:olfactory receptor 5A1-like [Hemicordylus capensis]